MSISLRRLLPLLAIALALITYGIGLCLTIIGIPWGRACLVIGQFSFLPFGREAISRKELKQKEDIGTGGFGVLGNIIWFVFAGLWLAIDFTIDKKTRAPFPTPNLMNLLVRAKQKGVITKTMGLALEFAPPLTIRKEEIDFALKVIGECITEEEKALGL